MHQLFATISSLEVNLAKSKALNLTLSLSLDFISLQALLAFLWSTDSFPYLGLHLTATYDSLCWNNYSSMLTKLTSLMTQWSFLHTSWLGKMIPVKMTLLNVPLYYLLIL